MSFFFYGFMMQRSATDFQGSLLRCSGEWLRVYYLLLAMQRICYPLQNECQGLQPEKMNESLMAVSDAADMLSAAERVSGFVTRNNK